MITMTLLATAQTVADTMTGNNPRADSRSFGRT